MRAATYHVAMATAARDDRAPAAPNRYLGLVRRIESTRGLDRVVDAADPVASRLIAKPRRAAFFRGDATGIPPHVVLTDVPFGAWFMALFLDTFRDESSRVASRRLIGAGVIAAAPTAIAGWAEWARQPRRLRRVGVVHASANVAAVITFGTSWLARRQRKQGLGVALGVTGGAFAIIGGFLGGHLRAESRSDTEVDREPQSRSARTGMPE